MAIANNTATTSSTADSSAEETRTGNNPVHHILHKSPHQTLPMPINAHRLQAFLKGYNSELRDLLYKGLTQGFIIPSSYANTTLSSYTNHRSALDQPAVVTEKINKELLLGRIAGPFSKPPLPESIISPLGLVPKKNSSEWRLIHDLSFPKLSSVNSKIDSAFTRVQYESLDHAISIIALIG